MVTAERRRLVVTGARRAWGLSERRACRYTGFSRATVRYRSVRSPERVLRERLKELAAERPRWGYRRLHVLLRREGQVINHKRVYRTSMPRERSAASPIPKTKPMASCTPP